MKIRAATPADVAAMMALAGQADTAAQWQHLEYLKIFAPDEGARRRHALVLEADGRILGFAIARELEAAREWEIESLAVSENQRRRGLGTRLLNAVLDLARSHGAREIFLEVRESNHAARALYQSWGWMQRGRRPDYYQNPTEAAILYNFSVSPAGKKII